MRSAHLIAGESGFRRELTLTAMLLSSLPCSTSPFLLDFSVCSGNFSLTSYFHRTLLPTSDSSHMRTYIKPTQKTECAHNPGHSPSRRGSGIRIHDFLSMIVVEVSACHLNVTMSNISVLMIPLEQQLPVSFKICHPQLQSHYLPLSQHLSARENEA